MVMLGSLVSGGLHAQSMLNAGLVAARHVIAPHHGF